MDTIYARVHHNIGRRCNNNIVSYYILYEFIQVHACACLQCVSVCLCVSTLCSTYDTCSVHTCDIYIYRVISQDVLSPFFPCNYLRPDF